MDVSAAMVSRRKKRVANSVPSGRALNTFGSTSYTRLGPLAGLIPKAKTAGKIATPAKTAMSVSAAAMLTLVFSRLSSLRM